MGMETILLGMVALFASTSVGYSAWVGNKLVKVTERLSVVETKVKVVEKHLIPPQWLADRLDKMDAKMDSLTKERTG